MTKRGWVALCAVAALVLVAILARPRLHRSGFPTAEVQVGREAGVFEVPFRLAERLGFFRQEGVSVRIISAPAALRLTPGGTSWPIVGVVGSRPDAFVVSAADDPGFRLAWLAGLPLAYPRGDSALAAWAKSVLSLHEISPASLDPLSPREIELLWTSGHLPYLLADAPTWLRLSPPPAPIRPAAALGASTGPGMAWVLTGHGPEVPRILAALNLALWYLHTHSPQTVASVFRGNRALKALIAVADRYGLYAASTYPTRQDYERSRRLALFDGRSWPPYERAVDRIPAVHALALTP